MLRSCPDDLPNPHKSCLREMLNTLICNDQDVKRLNTELRNLQKELDEELRKIEKANQTSAQVKKVKQGKNRVCEPKEDLSAFTKRLVNLDEVKHFYSKRAEEIRKRRDSIIVYATQCMKAYGEEKCKFRAFHENTVDYIKRTAVLSQDTAVVLRCERDICQMQKRFVREVATLKQCESQLNPFFRLLRDSDANAASECCCLKDYEWLPANQSMADVDAAASEFKNKMGKTLVSAFAQLHVHMPQDMNSFLAGYLMNVERNEQEVKEKLDFFQEHDQIEAKDPSQPSYSCQNECAQQNNS